MVGAANVNLALSLIDFDPELQAAMAFVFGSTLVCQDAAAAKKVTFDKTIGARSVTLDGDVFDPAGTITGGSASPNGSVLTKLAQLNAAQLELKAVEAQCAQLTAQLKAAHKAEAASRDKAEALELLQHEVALLTKRLDGSMFSRLQVRFYLSRWIPMISHGALF